jgi:hypothetical protein
MGDRAKIHDDRPMDLRELLRIKLVEQLLQRRPDHRLGRFPWSSAARVWRRGVSRS